MFKFFATIMFVAGLGFVSIYAQGEGTPIDSSKVPQRGANAKAFAPAGWIVEGQVRGDLNGDGSVDLAIKLVQAKRGGGDQDRQRALVIALAAKSGGYERAAVAGKLLQCTQCGGAFYGVMEAPSTVSIVRGVVIVNQDHGSRDVTESIYRLRYDSASGRFILIGLDVVDRDRATGQVTSVSTNFLTGARISKTMPAKGRATTKNSKVSTEKRFVEDIDYEALESTE